MVSERIQIYKHSSAFAIASMVIGVAFFLTGVLMLIYAFIRGFDFTFIGGDWNSLVFAIQGVLFFGLGYNRHVSMKYFVEWNNKVISYLLPGDKQISKIELCDITNVTFTINEAQLQVLGEIKAIRLTYLGFTEAQKIKMMLASYVKVEGVAYTDC